MRWKLLVVGMVAVLSLTSLVSVLPDNSDALFPEIGILVGDDIHGYGYYETESDGATLVKVKSLASPTGDLDQSRPCFEVASYLVQDSDLGWIAGYESSIPDGAVVVNAIRGQYQSEDGRVLSSIIAYGLDDSETTKNPDGTDIDSSLELTLIIPSTIRVIGGGYSIGSFGQGNNSIVIFKDRNVEDTLVVESGAIHTKASIAFPDNTTFSICAFNSAKHPAYLYIGANSVFTQLNNEVIPKKPGLTVGDITYTETRCDVLFNIYFSNDVIKKNFAIYQDANAGILSQTITMFKGYYLSTDDGIIIVDPVAGLEESGYSIFLRIKDSLKNIVSSPTGTVDGGGVQISLTLPADFSDEIQMSIGDLVSSSLEGVFVFAIPPDTYIADVKKSPKTVSFYSEGTLFAEEVVEAGDLVAIPSEVPRKDGHKFISWQLDSEDYDFNMAVTSDLDLIAHYDEGGVYFADYEVKFGTIFLSGCVDEYGQIDSGASFDATFVCPEKVDIRGWVVLDDSGKHVLSKNQTLGAYTVSSAGNMLSVSAISSDLTIEVDCIYLSESTAPTPVISTDTPVSVEDITMGWYLGEGQISNAANQWAGGSSEPLVLDDYVYVREGESIFKIDSNTGLVVASAPTKMNYTYYHQLGYLGNGFIVDYNTNKVYDMDLEYQGFKVGQRITFDPASSKAYGITSSTVCQYDPYDITEEDIVNEILVPKWRVTLESDQKPFGMYGYYTQPIILNGIVYWVSATSNESNVNEGDGVLSSNVSICYTSGETVGTIRVPDLDNLYLDNGWLSTDGSNLYLTGYTAPLFPTSNNTLPGNAKVAVIFNPSSEPVVTSFELQGNTLASAFVVCNDIGFVKVGSSVYAYDMAEFNSDSSALQLLSESGNLGISHGSITVNNRHADEGIYYIYVVSYDTGTLSISEYDVLSKTFSLGKMSDNHTYSSQGVRTTLSGNLVYYDDSGKVFGYVAKDKNTINCFINDGITQELLVVSGDDVVEALSGSEYLTVSNGFVLGARTTASEMSDGYSLYGFLRGVWVPVEDMSLTSLDNCRYWFVSKDSSALPASGSEWNVIGQASSYVMDYLPGYSLEVMTSETIISQPYVAYGGMVVLVAVAVPYDDSTPGFIITESDSILTEGKTDSLGNSYYGFTMPREDATLVIGINSYTVTLNLSGGSSSAVTSDNGWSYDDENKVWSKQFLEDAEFPLIDVPTKVTEDGYDYVFLRWEPALPDTVAESASYAAVFDQRFTVDNLVYSVADSDAKTANVVGYEVEPVGALEIPASVEYGGIDYAVSVVAEGALADCVGITSLVLNADTELHAFYKCYGLESITICEGVKSIGISTFAYSDGLKHVEFPSSLEEIGVNAFYKYSFYGKDGSRLAHTAENLAGKTFEGSSKALRESFEAGGLKYTFQGKADLSVKVVGYSEEPAGALVVPASVEYGGDEFPVATVAVDAFRDCTGITSVDLGANAALHSFYKCSGLESLTVRDGVTSIGLSAFAYCDSLRHVEFPSTLEKVGVNAFYKYSFYGMDGTKLARTAENFAGKIFEGSSKSLRESFVADGLKYTFQAGDSPSVKLMGYTEEPEGELVVPASVEYGGAEYPVASVAQDAFRGCGGITSVVLGTNAGLHSFYRCSGLESLTISEGVTWIGVSAFAYCDGLTSVEFPSTMAKISSNAFYRCSGLESLVLNGGALEIGVSAFAYCDGIGHIEFAPTLAKIGTNAFYKFAFYDADGAKLAKSPANLAGKTFEGESKALYQVS